MSLALKPYCSVEDQMVLLERRGMLLERASAAQWLSNVGYYRLSGYWYPYRGLNQGLRLDKFVDGADFSDVAALYEFDRKLRTLVHDGIERVEIMLRTQINDVVGAIGPLAHLSDSNFRPSFDHEAWLQIVQRRIDRSLKRDDAVKHYQERYGGLLPIWVLSEILDFSDISRLYEALPASAQWKIAERVGIRIDLSALSKNQAEKAQKNPPLTRWLEQLVIVRNTSAHHARLWNRTFTPVGTAAMRTITELRTLPKGQNKRIYGALCMMGLLLETASPGNTWKAKVRDLVHNQFSQIQGRDVAEMGFPESWFDDPFWSGGRNV
jgi:abortive infection bacteriophage resistance protein